MVTPAKSATVACWERYAARAISNMHLRLSYPWTIEHLAHVAAVSPFHFIRLFRHITGMPPLHFGGSTDSEGKILIADYRCDGHPDLLRRWLLQYWVFRPALFGSCRRGAH